MKLKNKMLIILLVAVILMFSASQCFASETNATSDTDVAVQTLELSDEEVDFINAFLNDNPDYKYVFVKLYDTSKNNHLISFVSTYEESNFYLLDLKTGKYIRSSKSGKTVWYLSDDLYNVFSSKDIVAGSTSVSEITDNVFYSNVDIYTDSTCTEVLFQAPPAQVEAQGVVSQSLEGVQMTQVMMEILGLVPLAIGLLVSVIGLRKGLVLLQKILKRS